MMQQQKWENLESGKMTIYTMFPKFGTSTKTFSFEKSDWILRESYKAGKYFKGIKYEASSLTDFFQLLSLFEEENAFLIHGKFKDNIDLNDMVRRKRGDEATIKDHETNWFCFDIDNWDESIERFIESLPVEFHNTSYIKQYSASYQLTSTKEKAHLFFWLKTPILNTKIQNWVKNFNDLNAKKVIDPSILTATQPVYVQRRKCIGADDPVEKLISLIEKEQDELDFSFDIDIDIDVNGEKKENISNKKSDFNASKSIQYILNSDSYHDEIRSLALHYMNQGMTKKAVKSLIEALMIESKKNINDTDNRWKERYNDIDRAIESASNIVDNPLSLAEAIDWIHSFNEENQQLLEQQYAEKLSSFVEKPREFRNIVNILNDSLFLGLPHIKNEIKAADKEKKGKKTKEIQEKKEKELINKGLIIIKANEETFDVDVERVALHMAGYLEIFKSGNNLSIVSVETPKTIQQVRKAYRLQEDYPSMPIIKPIDKNWVEFGRYVGKAAVFKGKKGKIILPNHRFIQSIISHNEINWKPLSGIAEHPSITNEWKLISENGYNPKNGVYTILHPKLKVKKTTPENALRFLSDVVLREFPFKNEIDKIATISAMMTGVQRPYLSEHGGFPGFAVTSPAQSSGKTTLIQLISHAVFNRPIAATSWPREEEEMGKQLIGLLSEGQPCVLFDNIKQGTAVKSEELAKVMTNDSYKKRLLGVNDSATVPCNTLWMFTGNNIDFVGDFATRVISAKLYPDVKNPEKRTFSRENIGEWSLDNRKKIISALLSIIVHGKNFKKKDFGSSRFLKWDKFVRIPLQALTNIDLRDCFDNNSKEDLQASAYKGLLSVLYNEFGEKKFQTRDIIQKIREGYGDQGSFESDGSNLKDSIIESFNEKAANNANILGKFLSGIHGKFFDEFVLEKYAKKTIEWIVMKKDY